jgi:3D (Asp-Asp-Asp) domain-containing protein
VKLIPLFVLTCLLSCPVPILNSGQGPQIKQPEEKRECLGVIAATAYFHGKFTASGIRVRVGHIALSKDLREKFKPKFGDKIILEGIGEFEFQDHMPPQWSKKCDIYFNNLQKALEFGKKRCRAWLVRKPNGHSKKIRPKAS